MTAIPNLLTKEELNHIWVQYSRHPRLQAVFEQAKLVASAQTELAGANAANARLMAERDAARDEAKRAFKEKGAALRELEQLRVECLGACQLGGLAMAANESISAKLEWLRQAVSGVATGAIGRAGLAWLVVGGEPRTVLDHEPYNGDPAEALVRIYRRLPR